MKKIIAAILAVILVVALVIWYSVQKAALGDEVMKLMVQVGKTVRECQEATGKTEAECNCLNKVKLDQITEELKELIADHPGLEDQTVAGNGKRIRIGDLVPTKSFGMYCK